MKSFKSFIPKTNKFKYLQRKSDQYGFDSTELQNNKAHQIINAMTIKDISVSNLDIDMRKAFWANKKRMKHYVEYMDWGVFENPDGIWEPYEYDIDEFVKEKLTIGKTHFIFVSMDNYNEKDSVHEGVLIIHNNTAYYINSHGKWSPKEQNGVEYKKPIDYIFLNEMFKYVNKKLPGDKKITFNMNTFYLGACLQEYDNYGFCYIFPFTMWLMLNNHYKDGCEILSHNGIEAFVYWCFKDFNPVMECEVMKCYGSNGRCKRYKVNDYEVQSSLEKNVYFMKKVLNTTISYLTQKKLLKKYNI